MNFTASERAFFEYKCECIREKIAFHQGRRPDSRQHVAERLQQLAAMSREELIRELEADHVLWERPLCWDDKEPIHKPKPVEESPEKSNHCLAVERQYEFIRTRIANILEDPDGLVYLKSGQDQHIWDRLNQTAAMSREELMNAIEADIELMPKCYYSWY